MRKKTKIVCTLGPSSTDSQTIEQLIKAGMNVARINFSHGTYEEQRVKIDNFKAAREKLGVAAALLLDTKGPEIRLKTFEKGHEILEEGQTFTFTADDCKGTKERVSISYPELPQQLKEKDVVLVDDGRLKFTVESVSGNDIICKVVTGGKVSNRKGINVPNVKLDMEYLSVADKSDILFGIENDIDYIAASFVRRGEDLQQLKDFLDESGRRDIKIIAKIESSEGVSNIDEILKIADGIMVARGDMGVEVPYERLPSIQKAVIRKCCQAGKISITATQMLESMIENPTPTRAEITDVANAVYDGTSAVMLSGETAVGTYPVEVVEAMSKIVLQAERDAAEFNYVDSHNRERMSAIAQKHSKQIRPGQLEEADVSDAVGHAAYQAAKDLGASAIIAVTKGGSTAERMAKYKPRTPVIAATPNKKTFHQQSLTWGVHPIITDFTDVWVDLMEQAMERTKALGVVKTGDWVVISAGMPLQVSGKTNLIRIERVK